MTKKPAGKWFPKIVYNKPSYVSTRILFPQMNFAVLEVLSFLSLRVPNLYACGNLVQNKSNVNTQLRTSHHSHYFRFKNSRHEMKVTAVFVATLATVSAFVPSVSNGRVVTELMAAKKEAPKKPTLFNTIFNMDLFAPVSTQNDYGARDKKNVS